MTETLQSSFAACSLRQPAQSQMNMLVMGHGKMGAPHLAALARFGNWMEAQHGIRLNIGVVDQDPAKLASVPAHIATYPSVDDALYHFAPQQPLHGIVAAFNDKYHADAYRAVFAKRPEVSFILAEKPITETIEETRELYPAFASRYVSLNTIINFSPAFDAYNKDKAALEAKYGALTPIGYQAVWGKDRTQDARPTIGVRSEAIHALGVVQEVLAQDHLVLNSGSLKAGYLAAGAQDVPFDADLKLQTEKLRTPVDFHCSYELPTQARRVVQYLRSAKGEVFAAEFNFDAVKQERGGALDEISFYKIDPVTGRSQLLSQHTPTSIDTGLPAGLLPNDKIGAWIGRSMTDVLDKLGRIKPSGPVNSLSHLDKAFALQEVIEGIETHNTKLAVQTGLKADPASAKANYSSVADMEPVAMRSLLTRYGVAQPAPARHISPAV